MDAELTGVELAEGSDRSVHMQQQWSRHLPQQHADAVNKTMYGSGDTIYGSDDTIYGSKTGSKECARIVQVALADSTVMYYPSRLVLSPCNAVSQGED